MLVRGRAVRCGAERYGSGTLRPSLASQRPSPVSMAGGIYYTCIAQYSTRAERVRKLRKRVCPSMTHDVTNFVLFYGTGTQAHSHSPTILFTSYASRRHTKLTSVKVFDCFELSSSRLVNATFKLHLRSFFTRFFTYNILEYGTISILL